ncbi:DUF2431 domain-containing protein [Cephalotus follicularis]|uniref:DUF2431 domain-containing protein n=1 Tax=Cephalotus follicularis TaxID=3775 RepID=A0A1Q3AVQ0_CEPFO|nr:DUF2431 domain-containing protein [Cephalotus follicularis]
MEDEEEKWVKHYSSYHQILLVGEGDFSFSLCLANSFACATNICASSLDTYDEVIKKYKKAKSNLESLKKLGASLLHGVDATKMKFYSDLNMRKFDRIIFNFPHAGFHGKEDDARVINMHRSLVNGFFKNASDMLRAYGEIHVSHKTTHPFCLWNIVELASGNSLGLIERLDFKKQDYPGYNNKKGDSSTCDKPFPLGECSTFKFRLCLVTKKMSRVNSHLDFTRTIFQHPQEVPIAMQQQPTSFGLGYLQTNIAAINVRRESPRILIGCFNRVTVMHGRSDTDTNYFGNEALRPDFRRCMAEAQGRTLDEVDSFLYVPFWLGFGRYKAEAPGRTLEGYITSRRTLRSALLPRMPFGYDQHHSF